MAAMRNGGRPAAVEATACVNLEHEPPLWQDCPARRQHTLAMKVISLKAARTRLRPTRPVQPPLALTGSVPSAARAHPADDVDDRMRMRQNMAAMIVIVAIVVLGSWLIESLRTYSRIQLCIEAGHRNCVPIDQKLQPSPY
jgi:hypothetical protein